MISPLVATLWITLIGMALIFFAILLLWGLMEALMRLSVRFPGDEKPEFSGEEEEEHEIEASPVPNVALDRRKRAAAAAVAIALALPSGVRRTAAAPLTAGSTWQAVNRARQLTQSTHITRKS
jgi:Na+-transporting methylmalonyl-CoA/oxaloacetate decarboxylase gamma subunit